VIAWEGNPVDCLSGRYFSCHGPGISDKMLFHPLSIAVLVTDSVSLFFLFRTLSISIRFLVHETDGRGQLLSSAVTQEKLSLNGRLVFALQVLSFLLMLLGVSLVFPPILTGIMCGTGVLQISGETGVRMLLVKGSALLILHLWWQIDLANREHSRKGLSQATARAILCCVPFVLLGIWLSLGTLWAMYRGQSGDCCTLVYGASASGGFVFNPAIWLSLLAANSIIVLLSAFRAISNKRFSSRMEAFFLCNLLCWCVLATFNLFYFFSAYYYGVTQHHCLWCLFLPGNYSVGYLFFIIVAIMLSQVVTVFVAGRLVAFRAELSGWAAQKVRRSSFLIIAGMIAYFLLTLIPVALWKIQHGVWAV